MTTLTPTPINPKSISDRRLEANRRNAQSSTGPKTIEGKERSSRNAVKHGLAARMLDAPGLDPTFVQSRINAWMMVLNPRGDEVDRALVELAVHASFRRERCIHAQAQLIADAGTENLEADDHDGTVVRNSPAQQYQLMLRYEVQAEQSVVRLVKELRARAAAAPTAPVVAERFTKQPEPIPTRNEPNDVPTVPAPPTKIDVPTPKSTYQDISATSAKPKKSEKADLRSRMADRFGSTRPR